MHFEQSAILTVHNHVITRNPRISVTHDKHDKHKTWYLHINNVQEEDKGRYMCQINTVTAKTQFGYLHVVGMFHDVIQHLDEVSFRISCFLFPLSLFLFPPFYPSIRFPSTHSHQSNKRVDFDSRAIPSVSAIVQMANSRCGFE